MNDDTLIFRDETADTAEVAAAASPWLILIVDDDTDVHEATMFSLKDTVIFDKPLRFLHAYSGKEAVEILKNTPDVALILLDAVMESEEAGLSTVQVIREELGLENVRIILRTGQPGQVPELDTITRYDINGYKTKSELTRTRLLTTIIAALRSWLQLQRIENSRVGLRKIVEASNKLLAEQGLQDFAEGVITQMAGIFGLQPEGILCASAGRNFGSCDKNDFTVIAAAGQYRKLMNKRVSEIDNQYIAKSMEKVLCDKKNLVRNDSITIYFGEPSGRNFATWIGSSHPLKELDTNLLEIFCNNISLCAGNIELVNRLREQAWRDPVLKIPNMAALLERLRKHLEEGTEPESILAVVDIDGFTQINEMLGHEYGDEVLMALVKRLREFAGDQAYLARIGADVFALFAPKSALDHGKLSGITSLLVRTRDGDRELSISIGVAEVDNQLGGASSQLRNASVALKRAKGEGVGQVVHYSKEIGELTRERVQLLDKLKIAFAENRLFLVFQPQLTIPGKKVISCEALLRWQDEQGKFIPPDKFIPLAEQSGLIIPIGGWVLRMALLSLGKIHKAGFPDMRMAVNVSAMQLRRHDFLHQLDSALAETGIPANLLELEITESVSAMGVGDVVKLFNAIRERGVGIAVDDFGTGYSSLSFIDKWPVDRLKIDRSFVWQMEHKEAHTRLVDLVIPMGIRLSLRVLAEGVETEEQFRMLTGLGCHEAQGYLFSKPLPLDDYITWLHGQTGV